MERNTDPRWIVQKGWWGNPNAGPPYIEKNEVTTNGDWAFGAMMVARQVRVFAIIAAAAAIMALGSIWILRML